MPHIGNLAELLLTGIVLTICFIQQVTSQLTQPGHKYKGTNRYKIRPKFRLNYDAIKYTVM